MQIVSPKQMAEIENRSEEIGISKRQLMENAGKALAGIIDDYCRKEPDISPEEKSIVFLAGKGNNGGDCFVAANNLIYRGYRITIISVGGKPVSELAAEMYDRLPADRVEFLEGYRSESVEAAIEAAELDYMTIQQYRESSAVDGIIQKEQQRIRAVKGAILRAYVIVDGVFGTGFHGQLDSETASIFAIGSGAYRISVDVPSGGNCSTGMASEGIFKADETVTFGFMKSGMTQYPLKKYCGKITIADIGLPCRAVDVIENDRRYFRIERNQLASFPPKREMDSHKGNFGNILVIAGSASMRGAASFAALGALRSGAGLVRVASVEKCIDTVASIVPEATYIELESDDFGFMLYDSSRTVLLEAVKKADAVVIGCGMGVTPDTIEITRLVTENAECPVIIDADGINCIASDIDILVKKQTEVIITPHVGEMARLLGCESSAVTEDRIGTAERFAEEYGVTVVLKGAGTLIADSRNTAANHTGNSGMSVGGSGDILAGMIGTMAAQGASVFDSACAGVYMHGLAGDVAAERFGQEAMLPRDIISSIPEAFRIFKEKKNHAI